MSTAPFPAGGAVTVGDGVQAVPREEGTARDAADPAAARVWTIALLACAAAAGLRAGLAPLADPDLPMNLVVGEWIVRHHAVPYVEPFAWTRAGAPYYAYSWLTQAAFYLVLRVAGPAGLHALAALAGVAATLAGAWAGRALGLRPATAALVGAATAAIALETTPFLRPQLLMHVLVPLAWACTAWYAREARPRPAPLLALVALNAAAAGTHISFPAMAIPLALLVARPGQRASKVALAAAAVGAGWLLSPYGLLWGAVFRLNFVPNVLTGSFSPIGEMAPGFTMAPLAGAALASLPLLAGPRLQVARERFVYGALWLVGLLAFAVAFKALGPWWWCALPMTAAVLGRLPHASTPQVRRIAAALLALGAAASCVDGVRLFAAMAPYERAVDDPSLPSLKGFAAEPAARWVERHARPGAAGRLLTTFNYGSYLKWRLPSLSESIDGRAIFPDSAALPDATSRAAAVALGPWRSADLAVVPVTYPVAAVLDTSRAWQRIGAAEPAPWAPDAPRAGLWVRRGWWATAGAPTARIPTDGVLR